MLDETLEEVMHRIPEEQQAQVIRAMIKPCVQVGTHRRRDLKTVLLSSSLSTLAPILSVCCCHCSSLVRPAFRCDPAPAAFT